MMARRGETRAETGGEEGGKNVRRDERSFVWTLIGSEIIIKCTKFSLGAERAELRPRVQQFAFVGNLLLFFGLPLSRTHLSSH